MSIWRDIWKESLIMNSKIFYNQEIGESEFKKLISKYKDDGMIYYARGQAYERKGLIQNALDDYKRAKDLFPVEHWKKIVENTIKRVENNKKAEDYFNLSDFYDYLWFLFQKIYEFVYIDDFVRYICLSAISRASSEWPLSLIDFRTILELIVDNLLEENIDDNTYYGIDLKNRIDDLYLYKIIKDENIIRSMHCVRKNGNEATHNIKSIKKINELNYDEKKKELKKIKNFYEVLDYFNSLKK